MSWATNQSLYKIHPGTGGEGEWQFPVGPSAWLESTQLPCQYPPVHQVIRYTYTLRVDVPPVVPVGHDTLMSFLRGYKGTEEGVEVGMREADTEALYMLAHRKKKPTSLKMYVICIHESKNITSKVIEKWEDITRAYSKFFNSIILIFTQLWNTWFCPSYQLKFPWHCLLQPSHPAKEVIDYLTFERLRRAFDSSVSSVQNDCWRSGVFSLKRFPWVNCYAGDKKA